LAQGLRQLVEQLEVLIMALCYLAY
jgi:hypothetical protein